MSLKNKVKTVPIKYHTDAFRRNLEDHLPLLRRNVKAESIPSNLGLKYQNNFNGLLTHYQIPSKYRYVVMRVNKIINPRLCGVIGTLYIPSFKEVEELLNTMNLVERDLF